MTLYRGDGRNEARGDTAGLAGRWAAPGAHVLPRVTWAPRVSSSATQPGPLAVPGHPALSSRWCTSLGGAELAPWARGPPSQGPPHWPGGWAVPAEAPSAAAASHLLLSLFAGEQLPCPPPQVSLPQCYAMRVWCGHFLSQEPQEYSNLSLPEDTGLAAGPPPGTRGSFPRPEGPTPQPAVPGSWVRAGNTTGRAWLRHLPREPCALFPSLLAMWRSNATALVMSLRTSPGSSLQGACHRDPGSPYQRCFTRSATAHVRDILLLYTKRSGSTWDDQIPIFDRVVLIHSINIYYLHVPG